MVTLAYCFIAAGAVVTKNIPDYALITGVPGRQSGWMSRHGHTLRNPDSEGKMKCPESGFIYRVMDNKMRCMDLEEETPLPD